MEERKLSRNLFSASEMLTLPNGLSLVRLILSFFIYYLIFNRQTYPALIITLVAMSTDYFDGLFARKLNQISEWGKILDPVADKFCVGLGALALYYSYGLPLWVVIVIIGRDVLILLGAALLAGKLGNVVPSAWPGKIAVFVISVMLLAYLLNVEWLQKPLEYLAIVAIVVSFSDYLYRAISKLKR